MKWKIESPPEATPGSLRKSKWFAWYPVECTDKFVRWLEYVEKREQYPMGFLIGGPFTWFVYEYGPWEGQGANVK